MSDRIVEPRRTSGRRATIGIAVATALLGLIGPSSLAAEATSPNYALESSTMTMLAVEASSPTYSMVVTVGQPLAAGLVSGALLTGDVGFLNDLDADNDGIAGTVDLCPTQYAGCNDTNGDGCIDLPDPDADGDGVGRGACDCDDANAQIWGRPGEVRNVRFASASSIVWNPPASPGGVAPRYDVIRSSDASDFEVGAVCVESDDASGSSATDAASPATGARFYYLVRAENGCATGVGPLGLSSSGYDRPARTCP